MKWPWTPKVDPTAELLRKMLEFQQEAQASAERTQAAVIGAVGKMAEASGKQAEVLQSYLQLFKGDGKEPERWQEDPIAENKATLLAQGFPVEGTEADQAQWVLDHL